MNRPFTVNDNVPVIEVAKLISEKEIGFLPVVSADTGKLVGVISEKDLMSILCCNIENKDKPIKEFIIKDVITVSPDSTLKDCLEKFIEHKIRHLPVVRNNRVVGVVSVKDVLKLI